MLLVYNRIEGPVIDQELNILMITDLGAICITLRVLGLSTSYGYNYNYNYACSGCQLPLNQYVISFTQHLIKGRNIYFFQFLKEKVKDVLN